MCPEGFHASYLSTIYIKPLALDFEFVKAKKWF